VQYTLAQAEAEVARLEAATNQAVPEGPTDRPARWQEVPATPAELEGCLARAAQVASAATAALQQAEDSLRRWLAQVEAQRHGLVKEGPHSLR
jgi:hypothetical protein